MNILIVSFTFPPNKDGVSEAASAMARGFVARGWKVTVLTKVIPGGRDSLDWNGAGIVEYTEETAVPYRIWLTGGNPDYGSFLESGAWDTIIFHSYANTLYLALPLLRKIKGAKILVSHGYGALVWEADGRFPRGLKSWCHKAIRSLAMFSWISLLDRVVYLSETADFRGFYDRLIAKAARYGGMTVIPNGVDPEERGTNPAAIRGELGIADNEFMFLCVANYSPRKDQGYAARAYRKAAIPGSVLLFIGSEFNEHSRKSQSEDTADTGGQACGKVIWLDKQSRESTLDALAACDAFLLSSYHEAQPIALLEAMREGKPWVARNSGCIASMEGGLCVNSETEMSAAMNRIIADASLRERLSEEGRQAVLSKYNRKAYIESYCRLVEELTTSRN